MQDEVHTMDPRLEQRLIELETRLAFQEHALGELSEALADARAEGSRTAELLRSMLTDLRKVRTELYADVADEPPPPHY
ncbi:MAG: SlyX family protein [Pseudoxanthomonas sp.]|nr:SlyX family protein [Pseudoxanthomonas sp.]